MGRPQGTSNIMRTPIEKEKIIKRYFNGESITKLANEINTTKGVIRSWIKKYQQNGMEGLKSKTGKHNSKSEHKGLHLRKPKDKIEELEIELMKKDIEIARLKKGYMVRGVGAEKEYITSLNKNTK